jgi:hypothetical protein
VNEQREAVLIEGRLPFGVHALEVELHAGGIGCVSVEGDFGKCASEISTKPLLGG